jgi:pyruvate dehydrogenase E1 component beta subunit
MQISYAEAIALAIKEELIRDKYLTVIGEDIGRYGGVFKATKGLYEQFGPERIKDTPISETAILGTAVGSAMLGYRVIAEIMYIDFMTLCCDQIINQAAKMYYMSGGSLSVPVVIRTQCGAGIRNAAQHSQCLEAWYMHIPGLKVVMPSTPHDAKGLLKTAVRDNNPVLFIEHKKLYSTKGEVPDDDYTVDIGSANVIRAGKDLTIISNSYMAIRSLQAAELLADRYGCDCEVIDLRSISPLDKDTILSSVRKTNKVAVVNEACRQGGIAGEIIALIQSEAFDYLDWPVLRVCSPDTPVPSCPELEDYYIPDAERIVEEIRSSFFG